MTVVTALDDAFQHYQETIHGYKVKEPGKELLAQLEDETHLDTRVAKRYIEQLKAVIDAAQHDIPLPASCCDHHRSKYETLRRNLPHKLADHLKTVLYSYSD